MRINKTEHLKHAWRVHQLLPDLTIEDVWRLPVQLSGNQRVTDLNNAFVSALERTASTGLAGYLFRLRFFLGKVFGWDDNLDTSDTFPAGSIRERYAQQEGKTTRTEAGHRTSDFKPVYTFDDEMLSEIENTTVLAAVHLGRIPEGTGNYGVQMTVYVKPKGLLGKVYMLLIKPFRLLIVYPAMLRMIAREWKKIQQQKTL